MKKLNNNIRRSFALSVAKLEIFKKQEYEKKKVCHWLTVAIMISLFLILIIATIVVTVVIIIKPNNNSQSSKFNIIETPTMLPSTILNSSENNKTSFISLLPSIQPLNTPLISYGYLHTSASQIVDSYGKAWRLTGVSWSGFETSSYLLEGLDIRNYKKILDQIKNNFGFNVVRIPFSNEMIRNGLQNNSVLNNPAINPELFGQNSLQCLDKVINYCGKIQLGVVLERFSAKTNNYFNESLWYIPNDKYYTEQQYISDWIMLAKRYKDTIVLGADIWHIPSNDVTWGSGKVETDWNLAAERVGNAILSVNPRWLIFIGGINNGVDLTGVSSNPVILKVKNKVVYSTSLILSEQKQSKTLLDSNLPNDLRSTWETNFGYIRKTQIAPVIIGSFRGSQLSNDINSVWFATLLKYVNGQYTKDGVSDLYPKHTGMSWNYFALNPGMGTTSGGLLKSDWSSVDTTVMNYLYSSLAPLLSIPYVANANPSQSIGNVSSLILIPSRKPSFRPSQPTLQPSLSPSIMSTLKPTSKPGLTASPSSVNFGYFKTFGSQIVDNIGKSWRLTGIHWSGFDTKAFILQGLWSYSYQSILIQLRNTGFNSIRISFSNEMIRNTSITKNINFNDNPDLKGLTPIECLDKIVDYCGLIGLKVILERHSSLSNNNLNETLWYIPKEEYYTETRFIFDWVMLALRYKGTAVIGADLWNEPKGNCSWGSGNINTDWNLAAERVGNEILKVNSDWLIIVEGINYATDLTRVVSHPINLIVKNKLVYSVHLFSIESSNQSFFHDTSFPHNLRSIWNSNFGYIVRDQIAPVWIGAFGTSLSNEKDHPWLTALMNYTNGQYTQDGVNDLPFGYCGISWNYWAVSPYGPTGGIVDSNWTKIDMNKISYLKPSFGVKLNPFEGSPLPNFNSNKSINNNARQFGYFHTSGNQIVDGFGDPYQITGVNWNGFDLESFLLQGLASRNYKSILNQIQQTGFNCIRLTFSNEMLKPSSYIKQLNEIENPDLKGLSPLEVMDKVIQYCGVIGIRVILVRFSSLANNYYKEFIWYIPNDDYYTEERFIKDWVMLALRYKGTAVIGADLWQKPKGSATWGSGNNKTDWNLVSQRVGNAILSVNPFLLIIVEGTEWSYTVKGAVDNPIILNIPNKVVYSVHVYGFDKNYIGYTNVTVPTNQRNGWFQHFGFVYINQLAPLLIGEFGASLTHPSDSPFLSTLMRYMNGEFTTDGINDLIPNHKGISWCYYSLFQIDSVGGVFFSDQYTVDTAKLDFISPYFASSPSLLLPPPTSNAYSTVVKNVTSVYAKPTMTPTTMPKFGFLSAKGNQLVDKNGKYWRLTGINWYGFEGIDNIIQGLWIRNYVSLLQQIKEMGFNCIRVPFSNYMFKEGVMTSGIDFISNPDLEGLTPLECLDKIVATAGSIGLRIILDRHSCLAEHFHLEGLWYVPGDEFCTEQRFIDDWIMLAKRYKGSAVIGADLWNEPKKQSTWGSGNITTDWNKAAERVGEAIQSVNQDWLLFVEGVGGDTWWGGDLREAGTHPVHFPYPNKLVYSVHEYCLDVSNQTWFHNYWYPLNLRGFWDPHFGYLFKNNTAPMWVGEFGTAFKYEKDYPWLERWIKYMDGELNTDGVNDLTNGKQGMSWMFWAVNPGGDTGGVLQHDWFTVDTHKLSFIKQSMAPLLNIP